MIYLYFVVCIENTYTYILYQSVLCYFSINKYFDLTNKCQNNFHGGSNVKAKIKPKKVSMIKSSHFSEKSEKWGREKGDTCQIFQGCGVMIPFFLTNVITSATNNQFSRHALHYILCFNVNFSIL